MLTSILSFVVFNIPVRHFFGVLRGTHCWVIFFKYSHQLCFFFLNKDIFMCQIFSIKLIKLLFSEWPFYYFILVIYQESLWKVGWSQQEIVDGKKLHVIQWYILTNYVKHWHDSKDINNLLLLLSQLKLDCYHLRSILLW